ncbi:Tas retrotransposon peptidase A16, partial [Trichostrongylus colubriformis]
MSGIIRQQIGIAKRQLLKALQDAEKEHAEQDQIQQSTNDDILAIYEGQTSTHDYLYRTYARVDRLWKQWIELIQGNPEEEAILQKYITKYGDFRLLLNDAISTLERLDQERQLIEAELRRRKIEFEPYIESDGDSQHSSEHPMAHQIPHPAYVTTASPQIPTSQTPATSNMSFVDASILSKLDLPIFEGNLLEFPEYWARFSTLIGDKPQLDGATKFSLLKSTLRGRALQTIKGLAITAANYPIAVEILKNHFEDRVTTRHILYTRLASLPSCDNEGRNLFALYSQMFAMVRQFTTYEDDSKEYALGAILLNKLPRHIRSRVYDHTGNNENLVPTQLLHILTKIVRKEAVLEEMAGHSNFHGDFLMNAAYQNKKPQPRRTEPQLPTRTRQLQKTCPFCGDIAHNSSTCTTYKTPRERVKVIKTKHLCYNCLSPRHTTKQCPSKNSCIHCCKRHHSSVCFTQNPAGQPVQRPHRPIKLRPPPLVPRLPLHRSNATIEMPNQDNISTPTDGEQRQRLSEADYNKQQHQKPEEVPRIYTADIVNANVTSKASLMMCVPITLYNPDQPLLRLDTTAFFDSGSSTTIIKKDIAQRLNLKMEEEQLISFQTFAKREPQSHLSSKVKVGLLLENCEQIVLHARTLPFIMEPMHMELLNQHQRDNTKTWSVNTQPGLLIGSDYFWELMLSDNFYIKQLPNGYNLIHSRLGNIITGKPLQSHQSFVAISDADDLENPLQHQKLEEIVEKFWSLESVGISDEIAQSDDDRCLQEFTDTIHFDLDEGRYVVQLPFKDDLSELSDNFDMAISRLSSTVNVLSRKSGLLEKYHSVIIDQLNKGIIEEVDYRDNPTLCHYLPHHGVISESSRTTKLRCVYDGSAKTKGKRSLNEVLYRGPVLLPEIPGILLRIRLMKILVTGDIEKAFLMVGLDKDSRNFTRFLWLRDPSLGMREGNIV